jgi:hypothetical protein
VDQGTNLTGIIDTDIDGMPRPVDGDVNGTALWDMGCYEYDAWVSDSDGDTMADGWEYLRGLNPTNAADAMQNPDHDAMNNRDEYIADTDPLNAGSCLRITAVSNGTSRTICFNSSSNRIYSLWWRTDLDSGSWKPCDDGFARIGIGGADSMTDTNTAGRIYYRIQAALP